jgi:hypothetical protein
MPVIVVAAAERASSTFLTARAGLIDCIAISTGSEA